MARPSEQDIRKLEAAHKMQFIDLVIANMLFIKLLPKLKGKSKTSKEYISLLNFGKKIAQLAGKWYARQLNFEKKAGIPKADPNIMKYFLDPKKVEDLKFQAKNYITPGKYDPMFNPMGNVDNSESKEMNIAGIGIVPLIIWGVLALAAAFTTYQIVDELNTTAEEKQDLLKQTETTLKDLGVTGQQAAAIITSTQEQASGGGFGIGKLLLWGGIAYAVYEFGLKPKQAATASK